MSEPEVRPYGSWKSPISSDLIVRGTIGPSQPVLDGEDAYWSERRPGEGGRNVIVRRTPDGLTQDVTVVFKKIEPRKDPTGTAGVPPATRTPRPHGIDAYEYRCKEHRGNARPRDG